MAGPGLHHGPVKPAEQPRWETSRRPRGAADASAGPGRLPPVRPGRGHCSGPARGSHPHNRGRGCRVCVGMAALVPRRPAPAAALHNVAYCVPARWQGSAGQDTALPAWGRGRECPVPIVLLRIVASGPCPGAGGSGGHWWGWDGRQGCPPWPCAKPKEPFAGRRLGALPMGKVKPLGYNSGLCGVSCVP